MTHLPFKQVDVFTAVPYSGNPVAVIFDAESLSGEAMQRIARWTNLSETVFITAPTQDGADYRARIFTPKSELPFAGHPTLGAAHAVLEAGRATLHSGHIVQECGVGLVRLHRAAKDARLFFEVPPARLTDLDTGAIDAVSRAASVPLLGQAVIVDLGPRWLTAEVASIHELLAARPDFAAIAKLSSDLKISGINLFARDATDTEVRSFAPASGIDEDPVCGSGNAAVAIVLRNRGASTAYRARQGRCIGRDGYIEVEFSENGPIRLGGDTLTCVEGRLALPH
ncbi:MAG: PhzF family phenazine biosynthesis protein [Burkholderiaceae bacterium]|jgi:PhzF family phenazine biosynthesis protein